MTSDARLTAILTEARTIAVVGIKPESHAGQPAHDVPAYLAEHGYAVVPVPVYYPDVTTILGRPVFRSVARAAEAAPIDIVQLFRKSEDVDAHVEDILAARPRAVWMQLGIQSEAAARRLEAAGIEVVQDRCMKVEHRRLMGAR